MRRLPPLLPLILALAFAPAALATLPAPPDQIEVASGATGDLTVRIYDAATGGTLIYKQSFVGAGESVRLGPTGESTDTPANPLTTSLRTALTGDLAAGAGRYVEVTPDASPALPRVQLVLVPYAMRADHATTSDLATQSLDTQAVVGLDGVALEALFAVYNDDGGPPSTDPREGTQDSDGDGLPNFVDSDNDNDTQDDTDEVAAGTEINLPTPLIATLEPDSGQGDEVTQVTVSGAGFVPGLTAVFGSQNASVSNVTATSFVADVGPHAGPFPVAVDLTVTNANAESGALAAAFTFGPPEAEPPVTVTALPWTLAGATLPVGIVSRGEEVLVFGTQASQNRYAVDTLSDSNLAFNVNQPMNHRVPSAVSWNPSRVLHALRVLPSTNTVHLVRDGNGDNYLANTEGIPLETPAGTAFTRSPSLVFDDSGRAGGAYLRVVGASATAMAFHDRNGDNGFAGVNELVAIEAVGGAADALGDAVFDPSGGLASVYYDTGNARVRVAHDRSGDGDFDDSPGGAPELATVASIATPACLDASFDGSGRLAVVYALFGTTTLLYDRNGDADFLDANESQALAGSGATGCDVGTSALTGRLVIVHNPGNNLRLLTDLNDDGSFAGALEDASLSSPVTAPLAVATSASGIVRVLAPQGVVSGPVR